MDRTDVSLCLYLMSDSRTPYHELASKFGLSINAVHKRIAAMMEMGIIRTFTAHPSLVSLGAVPVWIYGRSEAGHPGDLYKALGADNHTYWVANSGGGFVYVGGYLRVSLSLMITWPSSSGPGRSATQPSESYPRRAGAPRNRSIPSTSRSSGR